MMGERMVPMVHVPDVKATADWYAAIGFEVVDTATDGDDVVWAMLRFGESCLMLNAGGRRSWTARREVDLYLHVDQVDSWFERVKGLAEVVEGIHDMFYGQREFIVRDCNGFWLTFGQPWPAAG